MKIVKIIKLRGKLASTQKYNKKAGQSEKKSGTVINFEQKIGTVPLKAGQLESM